jgi:lambda family phage minor tail protein L
MPVINTELSVELQKLDQPHALVSLYCLDATQIGGTIHYITNVTNKSGGPIEFQGITYTPTPIKVSGFDLKNSGTSSKPQVVVSNIENMFLPAVISLGDLVGAKFIRIRTLSKYLADGEAPNNTIFMGPDVMWVEQKVQHDRATITWQLTSVGDRFGMRLPRRQILKDETYLGCNFPGVSRNRVR